MSITVTPFLWYGGNAGEAIDRYLEVFPESELVDSQKGPDGKLFIGTFRVQGQEIIAMNGGPAHQLTEAFSLCVSVEGQEETDRISDALIKGGGEQGPCGWLTDAFGLTWQVIPTLLMQLMGDPDPAKSGAVQQAMLQMKRLDCDALQRAYDAA